MEEFSIGAVSRHTGYSASTIRYFEAIGFLPRVDRSAGGRRLYRQPHLERLTFIRNCRAYGLTQPEVHALIELLETPERPCGEITIMVAQHLDRLRSRMRSLQDLIAGLETVVGSCDGAAVSRCHIVNTLAAARAPAAG